MNLMTIKNNSVYNLYKVIFLYFRLNSINTNILDIYKFYNSNKICFELIYNQNTNKKHTFEYYKIKCLEEKINEFDLVKSKKLNIKDKSSLIAEKNFIF